jgi:hypothetical protein
VNRAENKKAACFSGDDKSFAGRKMARETGLEPATSTVTGWYSNQLSYSPTFYLAVQNVIHNSFFARLKTA